MAATSSMGRSGEGTASTATRRFVPLRSHRHALSRVGYGLVGAIGDVDSGPVILAHENHAECPVLQHPRELSFTLTNRQGLRGLIPAYRNRGVDAFLIVIAVVFVLVESKRTVSAAINAQFNRIGGFLGGILQFRSHWNDRSCTNKKGYAIERSRDINHRSTRSPSTRPEVVPGGLWQIHSPRVGAWFGHRTYQQRRSKHELVTHVKRARI